MENSKDFPAEKQVVHGFSRFFNAPSELPGRCGPTLSKSLNECLPPIEILLGYSGAVHIAGPYADIE